jgi:hypothetical protein
MAGEQILKEPETRLKPARIPRKPAFIPFGPRFIPKPRRPAGFAVCCAQLDRAPWNGCEIAQNKNKKQQNV